MDKRWEKLGDLLVNYSMEVKPGEKVMIAMTEVETYPLMWAVYKASVKAGAFVQVQFLSEELNRLVLKYGREKQIDWVPEIEAYGMEWSDVYFGLRGAHNLNVFWDIPADKLSALRRSMGKISAMRWEKTRWCLLRVPNAALADQAGVDEETITDMFFDACFIDWRGESKKWGRWVDILNRGRNVRVVGRDTDLSFSVEGRTWAVADGKLNMPDGEIATSPVESTVNGQIYFEFPGVLGGRLVNDIFLRWEKGKLAEASSSTNQDFLKELLNTDPGAKLIGEFAFGTNPKINLFCRDILLDEKIGGTVHIALGRSYPHTGGTNKSVIHWDIIKDLRKDGKVYLDDKLIFENGRMLL
ncbi:MAG: aminopeptidase [Spirochaetes bacterium]|mgnify:CR=1 FL=1|nr:MAG: aminopeptidase [Spirochaetota bacterium]